MRRHLDRDRLAGERLAGDRARSRRERHARDLLDRPEQIHEVGDVVRAHVEHRPAAGVRSRKPDSDASARGPGT